MMVVLLIAGIGLILAGLVAIGFGIPINEFGFGNTLIQAGTVAACSGMLLLGLWTAVKELKNIARRLEQGAVTAFHAETPAQPATAEAASHQTAEPENFGHVEPAPAPSASSAPPWLGEAAPRERAPDVGSLASAAEPAPAARPKRNLLFSSSSRKERERAQTRTAPSLTAPLPESAAPPPVPESFETPSASFDDAWPTIERSRSDVPPPRRADRTPSTFAEAGPADSADRYPPPVRQEEPAQVTVLKSGVVDGMAYSLYSDGSIEAQMPEGMMRFASIDELRSHLDHRS
jgi:hypothetical protein